MPLFQAIYLKEKNKLLKHIYNDEGLVESKPKINIMETGAGLKLIQSVSHREIHQHKSFQPKQTFYGLPSIDYQNYKYRKVPIKATGNKRLAPQNRLADLKVPLEQYVQNIQTQKRILSNIQLNDSIQPHEALRREFNRSKGSHQELPLNTEVSISHREGSGRHSVGMDRINELEVSNGLEPDNFIRIKGNQRVPQNFRIKTDRSKSDMLEKREESILKSGDISQRNSVSIKDVKDIEAENSMIQKWRAEFDEYCKLSKRWFAEYKQRLLKEDESQNGAKLHYLNIALKG